MKLLKYDKTLFIIFQKNIVLSQFLYTLFVGIYLNDRRKKILICTAMNAIIMLIISDLFSLFISLTISFL